MGAAGYSGSTCETNIDECESHPCKNGGKCKDGVNAFTCTCAAGYSGDTCETNIDECASNPCKNGGTCKDGVNSFTCTCAAGYSGTTCETKDVEKCPIPCFQHCIDKYGGDKKPKFRRRQRLGRWSIRL